MSVPWTMAHSADLEQRRAKWPANAYARRPKPYAICVPLFLVLLVPYTNLDSIRTCVVLRHVST